MLSPGDRIPHARVWVAPREPVAFQELVADGSALFLFFLFAWAKKVNRKEQRGLDRASGLDQHV